jgi:hypothetical protein
VVAAGVAVDARRAAELAGDDQENPLRQAAVLQVVEEDADGPVERRARLR